MPLYVLGDKVFSQIMRYLRTHRGTRLYRITSSHPSDYESGRYTKLEAKAQLRKNTKRLIKKRKQRNAWSVNLNLVPKDLEKRKQRERELNIYYDNMRYEAMLEAFEEHGRI